MSSNFSQTKQYQLPSSRITEALDNPKFYEQDKFQFEAKQPVKNGMLYRYRHGTSLLSFGEKIDITVISNAACETSVTVHSECSMPTQIVDWGQNKNNVTNAFHRLDKYVASDAPPHPLQSKTLCPHCHQNLPEGCRYCAFCGKSF